MTDHFDETGVDVVIVGAGPSGSICAAQLARLGRSVVVLDKETFPRFRLGESLLPQSLPLLEEMGALEAVKERFIFKYGARFHNDIDGRKDRFVFENAWKPSIEHAFQVVREEFDAILAAQAKARGADVRFGWQVDKVLKDEAGRAVGVEAIRPDGQRSKIDARFVVDASGRDLFTSRGPATTKIDGLDQTALFSHYEGVTRETGKLEGDIDIVLFASGDPRHPNWFWIIPFKDGRTSVGAVVSRAWMRDQRAKVGADTTALFDAAIAASPTATSLLSGAKRLWPKAEAAADFSYRVRGIRGPGWLCIGDAAGFVDPLFSSGVHLALTGGRTAADAIEATLKNPADEAQVTEAWEKRLRAGVETFILAVRAFYSGPLVDYLFVADKHTVLRRSITTLLAGDVFGDGVWLRDTRMRLEELLASDAK
jgi:flavin-dependent dehydrogenase